MPQQRDPMTLWRDKRLSSIFRYLLVARLKAILGSNYWMLSTLSVTSHVLIEFGPSSL
jgi:hypothetical protein